MREIKFRAQDIASNKWLYGDLRHHKDDVCIFEQGGTNGEQVKPNTVGQFTGLLDKDGREIYEGDIIMCLCSAVIGRGKNKKTILQPVINSSPKVVDFRMGAFGYVNIPATKYSEEEWLPMLDDDYSVIGNIHDTPELLNTR